ncbi:MAG: nodulation protein NfeD [Gammaproteobacteria bacterium]
MLLCFPLSGFGEMENRVILLDVQGAIGPSTSDYIKRNLVKAFDSQAHLVVLRIDTPGGLDVSMREIIQAIIASPVPVLSYVSPSGARAASAGTYILYASHIAAMAPATTLGAATPVQIAGFPGTDQGTVKKNDAGPMANKIINDAVAYIRGLAQMRGRNAEWAEKAVREADSLSASEALNQNVIEFVATDLTDLLNSLDGLAVDVLGQQQTLSTKTIVVEWIEPDWRSELLAIITDPNIAYILMLIGIYGLIYEFANPGMLLPGVVGAIALLLALFAFQVLPINYAGLALMIIGIVFMVGEVFIPSFGALGIGGVIAFVIGSIILLDTDVPGYGISIPVIGLFAFTSAGFFMFILGMAIKARQRPVVSGMEEMIGGVGEVLEDFEDKGRVRAHSEMWEAVTSVPLKRGDKVEITNMDGLVLIVKPLSAEAMDEGPLQEK